MYELKDLEQAVAFIENEQNYHAYFRRVIETCVSANDLKKALWNAGIITDAELGAYSARIQTARARAISVHRDWTIKTLNRSSTLHTVESLISTVYHDIFD